MLVRQISAVGKKEWSNVLWKSNLPLNVTLLMDRKTDQQYPGRKQTFWARLRPSKWYSFFRAFPLLETIAQLMLPWWIFWGEYGTRRDICLWACPFWKVPRKCLVGKKRKSRFFLMHFSIPVEVTEGSVVSARIRTSEYIKMPKH